MSRDITVERTTGFEPATLTLATCEGHVDDQGER